MNLCGDVLIRQTRPAEFVETVLPSGEKSTAQIAPAILERATVKNSPWTWVAAGIAAYFALR